MDLNLHLSDPKIHALNASDILPCLQSSGIIMLLQRSTQANGKSKSLISKRGDHLPYESEDKKHPLNMIHLQHKRLI